MKNSLGQEICMICFAVIDSPSDPEARFREICASCKQKIAIGVGAQLIAPIPRAR